MFGFNEKRGFYTVEASIFLPLVILAVLSVGYFMRTDSLWENVMHGALDECSYSAATCTSGPLGFAARERIEKRIKEDNPTLSYFTVQGSRQTCHIKGTAHLSLPIGFGRDYAFSGRIRYRDFLGKDYGGSGMGSEGLEADVQSHPVWIFPQEGLRYHKENCTYVKATVHSCILTSALREKYSGCETCKSGELKTGSIVFCFYGEDTSYHRGNCRTIKRHTVVVDESEAKKLGYTPCSKCGG